MNLSMLYRGPLSSCNYGCEYCPFAKHVETPDEHAEDERCLTRFVDWVSVRPVSDKLGVFFTPWGEALPHKRYQQAIRVLSHSPQIVKVAIQTNLSCKLDWMTDCDVAKLGLWCTYHPGETTRAKILKQCEQLDSMSVPFSVGIVGMKEHLDEIAAMRRELPANVYLWVNAYKRVPDYYSEQDLEMLTGVDPLFGFNNSYHASLGEDCRCGSTVISVNGEGDMTRCHFIKEPIGNIYEPNFESKLVRTPCTAATCGCHIGYVHMDKLGLYDTFGDGVLERIPKAIL